MDGAKSTSISMDAILVRCSNPDEGASSLHCAKRHVRDNRPALGEGATKNIQITRDCDRIGSNKHYI